MTTASPTPQAIELRKTLGAFATGVTVITARAQDGSLAGVTANSFNSVSLDPPLVLWSLASNSRSRAIFESASVWAVNILSATQEGVARHFATGATDKFSGIEFETGQNGVPLLRDCLARLQCRTHQCHEGGDHIVFIGEVLHFERIDAPPLLFHGGRFLTVPAPSALRHLASGAQS